MVFDTFLEADVKDTGIAFGIIAGRRSGNHFYLANLRSTVGAKKINEFLTGEFGLTVVDINLDSSFSYDVDSALRHAQAGYIVKEIQCFSKTQIRLSSIRLQALSDYQQTDAHLVC